MKFWDKVDLWIEKQQKRARRKKFRQLRSKVKSNNNNKKIPVWMVVDAQHLFKEKKINNGHVVYVAPRTEVLFLNRRTGESKSQVFTGHLDKERLKKAWERVE